MIRRPPEEIEHNRRMARKTVEEGRHRSVKLTPEDVREVRRLREAGLTHKEIAAWFGVERSTVSNLLRGHTWRWIQ